MGIHLATIYSVCCFVEQSRLPKAAHIIDLGAQAFHSDIDPNALAQVFNEFRPDLTPSQDRLQELSRDQFPGRIYEELGFKYNCVDVFEAENGFVCDLNFDTAPDAIAGKGDLVTNFGTTEHVMNQLNSFRFIHDLTRPGGLMWHNVPTSDFNTHGFFKYDPKLFWYLARANGYISLWMRFSQAPSNMPVPEVILENGLPEQRAVNTGIDVLMRRTSNAPFKLPLDLDVNTDDMEMADGLAGRYGDDVDAA